MENEQFLIKIKTNESLLNTEKELNYIITIIMKMAYETDGKVLDPEQVMKSLNKLLLHQEYGHYIVIIDKFKNKFCGINLVTLEHNINLNSTVLWLQSVYVIEEYRMKGLFRRLMYKIQDDVLETKSAKKIIKLYMDKDNERAEKVYLKFGFKVCKEILYELDFYFDDVSELKHHLKEGGNKTNLNVKILAAESKVAQADTNVGIFNDLFYQQAVDILSDENLKIKNLFKDRTELYPKHYYMTFESLINANTINFFEQKDKMLKIISDKNLGIVLILTDVNLYINDKSYYIHVYYIRCKSHLLYIKLIFQTLKFYFFIFISL